MSKQPSLPLRYHEEEDDNNSAKNHPLNLSSLSETINAAYDKRQNAYDISRKLKSHLIPIRQQIGTAQASTAIQDLLETYNDYFPRDKNTTSNRFPREAPSLSYVVEDLVQLSCYQHFLETGTLLPPSQVNWATDEEYLVGGVMRFVARDLSRYGLNRATVRDVDSVRMAANLAQVCLQYLLEFDSFRNGPLRRQYDATKYSLQNLETLLYELAITSPPPPPPPYTLPTSSTPTKADTAPVTQQLPQKVDDPNLVEGESTLLWSLPLLLPTEELQALRHRMQVRDEWRERLIKQCRDGQKAAKQCIFALHRSSSSSTSGNETVNIDSDHTAAARTLLQKCTQCLQTQLSPIVMIHEPALRYHTPYASVVEEYVEAKLFFVWLHGKEAILSPPSPKTSDSVVDSAVAANTTAAKNRADSDRDDSAVAATSDTKTGRSSGPSGMVLLPSDFEEIPLDGEEYIGGLCDLTGEIGRYAVSRGTQRDVVGVKQCLRTNVDILNALQSLERLPQSSSSNNNNHSVGKKLEAVQRSVEKLERMLYEMSLSEAAGGRNVHHSSSDDDDGANFNSNDD